MRPLSTSGFLRIVHGTGGFLRGDSNADGTRNIADAVAILQHLFGQVAFQVRCRDAADANDDGRIDIADAIALLGHLFAGRGPLPAPFYACGSDPADDAGECESYAPCAP